MSKSKFEQRVDGLTSSLEGFKLYKFDCGCIALPLQREDGLFLCVQPCDADWREGYPDPELTLHAKDLQDKARVEIDGGEILARILAYMYEGKDLRRLKDILGEVL